MAELTAANLSAFTRGRLPDDDATADLLAAALSAARRYCGWPVSPVEEVTVTVDGPGGRVLSLPTRNLLELISVTENGVALDVATLDVSRTRGIVEKYPAGCWTSRNGGITVTMSHGHTEDEAADWRRAVLRLATLMDADTTSQRDTDDMTGKKVDDVEYQWAESLISSDERLAALFSTYRILPSP